MIIKDLTAIIINKLPERISSVGETTTQASLKSETRIRITHAVCLFLLKSGETPRATKKMAKKKETVRRYTSLRQRINTTRTRTDGGLKIKARFAKTERDK